MRNRKDILSLLILLAFYCLSVGFSFSGSSFHELSNHFDAGNQEEQAHSVDRSLSIHINASNESFSINCDNHLTDSAKQIHWGDATASVSEVDCLAYLKQYSYLFVSRSTRDRKANLIFPFHNFW